jgi:CheY-specific phosphatase CheX
VNDTSLAGALRESTNEVLERMFFIECLSESREFVPEPEVVARLTFDGDPPGDLELKVSASAARSVAADFLGTDPADLSEQEIHDVVCELANMICGSVLSRVESTATFRLAAPRIMNAPPDIANLSQAVASAAALFPEVGNSVAHAVELGSGRLVVSMHTETPKWPSVPR